MKTSIAIAAGLREHRSETISAFLYVCGVDFNPKV
jgi:hypothetical protein